MDLYLHDDLYAFLGVQYCPTGAARVVENFDSAGKRCKVLRFFVEFIVEPAWLRCTRILKLSEIDSV